MKSIQFERLNPWVALDANDAAAWILINYWTQREREVIQNAFQVTDDGIDPVRRETWFAIEDQIKAQLPDYEIGPASLFDDKADANVPA